MRLQSPKSSEMAPDLGDVVRHVVDHVHVQVVRRLPKLLGKGLPGEERHAAETRDAQEQGNNIPLPEPYHGTEDPAIKLTLSG